MLKRSAEKIAMALPKKNSRTITVEDSVFRWHLALDKDYQQNSITITLDKHPNGAQLLVRFSSGHIVTPRKVRQAIVAGVAEGFSPEDAASNVVLSKQESDRIFEFYPREVSLNGLDFTWTPKPKGGLYMTIERIQPQRGQALSTASTLESWDLREDVALAFMREALVSGWNPEKVTDDCFWLEKKACERILADIRVQNKTQHHKSDRAGGSEA